jgi:hypothetical protein
MVHSGGVLALVMADTFSGDTTFPELLDLDFYRLQKAHAEFHLSVMAITTLFELNSRKAFPDQKPAVLALMAPLSAFFYTYSPHKWDEKAIQEDVIAHLKTENVDVVHQAYFQSLVEKVMHKEHILYTTCRDRVMKAWYKAAVAAAADSMPASMPPPVSTVVVTPMQTPTPDTVMGAAGAAAVPTGSPPKDVPSVMRTGFAHKGSRTVLATGVVSAAFNRTPQSASSLMEDCMRKAEMQANKIVKVIKLNIRAYSTFYNKIISDGVTALNAGGDAMGDDAMGGDATGSDAMMVAGGAEPDV